MIETSDELKKLSEQLVLVRPPLEAGLPVLPEDREETKCVKNGRRYIINVVFADAAPLVPADIEDPALLWSGRNGWLREYSKIGERRSVDSRGSQPDYSSEDYDSDFIFDSISPPGERRASCTVNLNACDFE
jgi:hypothetical protein